MGCMSTYLRRLLFCVAFFTSTVLWGQQPALRNYSVDDGLPSSEIYHIIQDSKGYIWMATNMGVSRFDGRTFKNFDVQNGLPENTVFEVYEDEIGRVWFISFPFQLSYFWNNAIHSYKYNNLLKKIAGNGLIPIKKSFLVDKNNNVYFSFLNGGKINKIDNSGHLEVIKEINNTHYTVAIQEVSGHLLAAQTGSRKSNDFIISMKTKNGELSTFIDQSASKYTGSYLLVQLTDAGDLLVAQNELLTHIKLDGTSKTYNFKDRILWLSVEKNNSIWIGKEFTGVEKYSLDDIKDGPLEKYLNGISVSSVLVDNEGGLWFSTQGSGVYYLPSKTFVSYNARDGLSGKNIKSVEIFKGKIFLGYDDNYFMDVIKKGKVTNIRDFGNSGNKIKNLRSLDDKVLWIGTEKHLHSYNNATFNKIINNHKSFVNGLVKGSFVFSIKDIYPLSSNEVLLAQMRSLSIVRNGVVVYDSYLDDKIQLRIESIERETDSSFLLGTFNGLWRLVGTSFRYLGHESALLRKRTTDIVVLPNGKGYVLATKGSGLIIKLYDSNSIFQLTQSNGLSSNSITSLLLTGNELWVATNNGLNLINVNNLDREKPGIVIFKKESGLISNEINQIKGDNNYVYIATNDGFTIFDRKKYQPLRIPPPVFIQGVRIMRRDTLIAENYSLKYNQNFITISFSGITFRDPSDMVYNYRLIGMSEKWTSTKNLEVEYAFLPPGKYRFEVLATNSEGLESTRPAVVSFIIYPPFWKTWWFISIIVVILIVIVIAFINYRMQQVKRENLMQNDVNRYRQQALIRQMDPHFVFNILNSIQSFIIKNDNLTSTKYLSKFSKLMRLVLNNSQKQEISLKEEIDTLNLYMELESLRFSQKFEFSIICDQSIDVNSCRIPAFIVQPFIENAIWHGFMKLNKAGKIRVNFYKNDDRMICTVEDNGIGRVRSMELKTETEKERSSLGILIVETRMKLLSDQYGMKMGMSFLDLYDNNHKASGTKVTIILPLIK